MGDVFQILPSKIIVLLERKLDVYFTAHTNINKASDILATDTTNASFKTNLADAIAAQEVALTALEDVPLEPTDLLTSYKGIEEEEVRMSNRYYSTYGSDYSVKN